MNGESGDKRWLPALLRRFMPQRAQPFILVGEPHDPEEPADAAFEIISEATPPPPADPPAPQPNTGGRGDGPTDRRWWHRGWFQWTAAAVGGLILLWLLPQLFFWVLGIGEGGSGGSHGLVDPPSYLTWWTFLLITFPLVFNGMWYWATGQRGNNHQPAPDQQEENRRDQPAEAPTHRVGTGSFLLSAGFFKGWYSFVIPFAIGVYLWRLSDWMVVFQARPELAVKVMMGATFVGLIAAALLIQQKVANIWKSGLIFAGVMVAWTVFGWAFPRHDYWSPKDGESVVYVCPSGGETYRDDRVKFCPEHRDEIIALTEEGVAKLTKSGALPIPGEWDPRKETFRDFKNFLTILGVLFVGVFSVTIITQKTGLWNLIQSNRTATVAFGVTAFLLSGVYTSVLLFTTRAADGSTLFWPLNIDPQSASSVYTVLGYLFVVAPLVLAGIYWFTQREWVCRIWGPYFWPTVAVAALVGSIALWENWFVLVDPLGFPEWAKGIWNHVAFAAIVLFAWNVLIRIAQHGTDRKEEVQ